MSGVDVNTNLYRERLPFRLEDTSQKAYSWSIYHQPFLSLAGVKHNNHNQSPSIILLPELLTMTGTVSKQRKGSLCGFKTPREMLVPMYLKTEAGKINLSNLNLTVNNVEK